MTPNLRLNKKITRKLIGAIPKKEDIAPMTSIEWGLDNNNRIFGLERIGFLISTAFYLQKLDDDLYRLIVMNGDKLLGAYIIDDYELFYKEIGIINLDIPDDRINIMVEALDKMRIYPNTGIIVVTESEVYVYEHCDQ